MRRKHKQVPGIEQVQNVFYGNLHASKEQVSEKIKGAGRWEMKERLAFKDKAPKTL